MCEIVGKVGVASGRMHWSDVQCEEEKVKVNVAGGTWVHAVVRCKKVKVKVLCCIYAQARCTWKGSNPILELIHTNTFICDVKLPNKNPINRKNHVKILHFCSCGQS